MESTNKTAPQGLSLLNKLAYGCSDMGNNIVFVVVTTYLMFYYTDILKLNLASVGLLFLIVRVADIFAGPIVGILVDRTTSKFGKARPWFLWMSVPYGLATILTFSIGYFPTTSHLTLAYLSYILFSFCMAGVNVPITAILPSLTTNQEERTSANAFRSVGGQIGGLIAGLVFLPLVSKVGSGINQNGFLIAIIIFAVISVLLFLTTFMGVREQNVESDKKDVVTVSVKDGLKAMLPNLPWWILMIVNTIIFIGVVCKGSTMVYFFKYTMNNANLSSIANGVNSGAMIVGMMLIPSLVKHFKGKTVVILGLLVSILGQLILYAATPSNSVPIALAGIAIGSFGLGGAQSLMYVLFADTVDYGEYLSGIRAQGLLTSVGAAGTNLGAGLAGVLTSNVLLHFHFVANVTQTATSLTGIAICFIWAPIIIFAICILLMTFYHINYSKKEGLNND